ncbi:MAG: protein kinase [Planctomycetota bacterium]
MSEPVHEAPSPQLIVLNGPHKGVVIVLDHPLPCVFGARAGVSLPEPALDAVHCQVFPSRGRWFLQDFGSEAGTWLGDDRLEGVRPLDFGRSFRIGDTLIALLLPDPASPADPDFIHAAEEALRGGLEPGQEVDLEDQEEAPDGADLLAGIAAEAEAAGAPVEAELVEDEPIRAEPAPAAPLARRRRSRRKAEPAKEATDVFDLDVPEPVESNALAPGAALGDYEVIDQLGVGSLGSAYKCFDRKRRRVVTLKVLDAELARRPDSVARFLRGAKAGSRLQHRHVVAVLGAGHALGRIYVVQEYVEGVDLEAFCAARGGFLGPRASLRIISRITEALVYAHGRKVIHRAVTPQNILIGPGGVPKLTDLTFAKRIKKPHDLDVSGAFKVEARSPYAPPEALLGAAQVGAKADIYGVGACLFRALTGRPPYGDDLGQLVARMLSNKLEPWGPAEGKLSDALREMIRGCLHPDPHDRFPAMRDLRDAIADLPEIAET